MLSILIKHVNKVVFEQLPVTDGFRQKIYKRFLFSCHDIIVLFQGAMGDLAKIELNKTEVV